MISNSLPVMSTGLTLLLLIIAGTLFVFWNRFRDGLPGHKTYLYVLGTILAVATGLLLSGLHRREMFLWPVTAAFVIWVVIPGLLLSWRTILLLHGRFDRARFVQKVIPGVVWSPVERKTLVVLEAAGRIDEGRLADAEQRLDDLKRTSFSSGMLEQKIRQVDLLLNAHRRNWSSVLHTYEKLDDKTIGPVWIPTQIFVARAYVEREQFERAEELLNEVESFSLTEREQLAATTVRMALSMCAGNGDQGEIMLYQLKEETKGQLPAPFVDYWMARGLHASGQFENARSRYHSALDQVDDNAERWKTAIEERLMELEMDQARPPRASSYSLGQDELAEPALEPESVPDSQPVREAEPVDQPSRQERPPPDVVDFIEKVNRTPQATVVLLTLICGIFLVMYFGVQVSYPEGQPQTGRVTNPTTDPVTLLVFGMKADYMIDEPAESPGAPLREDLDKFDLNLLKVSNINQAHKKINNQLDQKISTSQLQALWLNARKAHLFGFDREGNVNYPRGQYWRLATCTLLHIGWIHLILNGYALWILGKLMENIYGWRDYLIIYLVSGLAGSIGSWKFGASPASAGASGAIFGLLGAAIALTLIKREGMPEQIRNRLAGPLVFWTVVNLILGFVVPRIDNAGHIGGLIGGLLIGYLISPDSASSETSWRARLLKWIAFACLAGGYGWSIVRGVNFALQYAPQMV